ncbi:hypothetical protein [Candidatus Mycoplasma haematohominis]|uniref:Uncharacterized protein n=1 Tax=Candidatus Mycoplasma haematohominis TaxID=1494318 RepID=A0A478FT06_9MOLU|nr:hypothetical protein [Candidatus Mycoplasma haemohominis]GCE63516.1 hypothetical protein MHSWG343_05130 [Candidatus Mycoplasma haemohominis]
MDPTKLAVGAGVAVLVGGGGYGISALFNGDVTPNYEILKEDPKFSSDYSDANKVGKLYGNYLIAPYGSRGKENTGDTTKSNNKDWWEWSYARWKKDFDDAAIRSTLSDEFKDETKVKPAFSGTVVTGTGAKPLNQVCEEVYKKQKTDVYHSSDVKKASLWNDMWKYCSFFDTPLTIVEKSAHRYTGNQYGAIKKSDLVSVEDKNNSAFWDVRNSEFYAPNGDKSGTTVTTGIFHTEKAKNTHIKSICEDAYTKSSSDSGYAEADVVKFCSLG